MKRFLLVVATAASVVYGFSCGKSNVNESSCTGPKAVTDSTQLLAFAKNYGIHPTVDTSWMYYEIINPGAGSSPVSNSKLYVRYVCRLMNGGYVDSSAKSTRYALDSVIKGWQYGLPKIKSGGRIKLLVPSALAYGCNGNGSTISSSQPLYFDVYLDSLK
jgi:FKBP-type peptidyl-prolyl cis-trans isomerase FkpA